LKEMKRELHFGHGEVSSGLEASNYALVTICHFIMH